MMLGEEREISVENRVIDPPRYQLLGHVTPECMALVEIQFPGDTAITGLQTLAQLTP